MPDGEFSLIQKFFAPLAKDAKGAHGLMDDAAYLNPPEGQCVVTTSDMLVEGRHFLEQADASDTAWKSLAVNVSDLVAKGAKPEAYLLSLSLNSNCDDAWLGKFRDGLSAAQKAFGCHLLGGDTVYSDSPVTICITAFGYTPQDRMVHRSGARSGDAVFVTGEIGDAVLGLDLLQQRLSDTGLDEKHADLLKRHYLRPVPPVDAIELVRLFANASMDISDGLVADFQKLCAASGAGGRLRLEQIPFSKAVHAVAEHDAEVYERAITGGDDYQVLMTMSENAIADMLQLAEKKHVSVIRIGEIMVSNEGIVVLGTDDRPMTLESTGFDHFK